MIRRGQISELDCRTAESMVARYMNHTLKTDEMEEFLDHIEHCPSCSSSCWVTLLTIK